MTKPNKVKDDCLDIAAPEQEFVKRRPDFKGRDCAAWLNTKDGKEWLSISIRGSNNKLVAFRNILEPM